MMAPILVLVIAHQDFARPALQPDDNPGSAGFIEALRIDLENIARPVCSSPNNGARYAVRLRLNTAARP